jgi:hypothetical protein
VFIVYVYLSFRVKINGQCVRWIFDISVVRVQIKNKSMYLLSCDELKTYEHSAIKDIKIKIVIDFFLFERHGSKHLF